MGDPAIPDATEQGAQLTRTFPLDLLEDRGREAVIGLGEECVRLRGQHIDDARAPPARPQTPACDQAVRLQCGLMRRSVVVLFVAGVLAAVLSPLAPQVSIASASPSVTRTAKTVALQSAMRKLWEDHVTWTRLYLVSAIAGLPDTQPTVERLLRNQADIGNAVKPFYGDAAGAKVAAARGRWYANADEIAGFLTSANPR